MSLTWTELVSSYETPAQIPDEQFYDYINQEKFREDAGNQLQLGLEKYLEIIKQSPIFIEGRRRAKSDLYFLVKYFCWETNAECSGKPFSENKILDRVHRRLCNMFVVKDDTKTIPEQDVYKERLILYPRNTMKALDLDEKIPTPSGFKLIRDIEPGDTVYSSQGAPCTVTGVSPVRSNQECYELEFSSGETIVSDAGHLWITDARRDRDAKRNGSLKQKAVPFPTAKTTETIAASIFCREEHNHRVQVATSIQGDDQSFTVSPYVLGCWLGDGTSACAQLTGADFGIIEKIRKEGEVIRASESGRYRWVFNGGPDHPDYRNSNSLASRLRALGLLNNKHIPTSYLRASRAQRLSLLQGLMDTDGTISKTGECAFEVSNLTLARNTRELVASLGLKPGKLTTKQTIVKDVVGIAYTFRFTAYEDHPVFRLRRKRIRQRARTRLSKQSSRHIVAARKVPSRPVKCLMVDSPDHTFLVGEGFIPTHNSTIDVTDAVQWILNFPQIRILFLTAVDDRAIAFVNETKGHFVEKLYEPSLMNLFFPEFCLPEKELSKESAFEFTSPMWRVQNLRRKEPTCLASSITSDLSGTHFDVIKGDDIVSNRNSENEDMCKRVTSRVNVSVRKMLMPFGYFDIVGTRYADEDYYGDLISKNVGDLKVEKGPCWDYIDNLQMKWKILIGRAIVIKPEIIEKLEKEQRPVTYKEAGEEGCDLLFPEVLSYAYLMKDFALDEISFEGQRNNNARPRSLTPFTRGLLLRATVSFDKMPYKGPTSQTWDFAFSQKKGRDYTTGCCALWDDKGTAYINDLIRDRFQPNDLAQAVVDFARRWHPFVVGIEDAGGSRALEYSIQMAAQKTGDQQVIAVCNAIDWISPTNNKDAKRTRMGSLHPWLMNDQLKFSAHLPHLEALYSEFERCMSSHHHDDIPDVISRQTKYGPRMLQVIEKNEIQTWSQSNAAYNLLFEENCDAFGRPGAGWIQPINPDPAVDEGAKLEGIPGYEPILGAGLYG